MPKKDRDLEKTESGPKRNEPVCIGEEVKIGVNLAIQRFRHDPDQTEISLPSSLTTTQRAYVHRVCSDLGSLKTWSRGNGQNRYITITKVVQKQVDLKPSSFTLANCVGPLTHLLHAYPITAKEQQGLLPQNQKSGKVKEGTDKNGFGCISRPPQIPPKSGDSELLAFRQSLPVYKMKSKILDAIESNQVILVAGETGSGKTTQVPQLILESCCEKNQPCRILCTQPRRLAAISVSERIATERGERIGHTVGYQIRLESKISPKTLLTFCTTGILLRTMMAESVCLENLTHVLVDEVHERDKFTDFLLLCLKEVLPNHKNLRVILMSATLNMDLFSGYFNNCPVVCVPGNLYPVDEFFLEDILKMTEYKTKDMEKALQKNKNKTQDKALAKWLSTQVISSPVGAVSGTEEESDVTVSDNAELEQERFELEPWVVEEMDRLMQEVWLTGNEALFPQILYLISSESMSVDYIHPETSITPLMIAAGRGFVNVVEHLLNLGANVNMKTSTEWTALDFARKFQQNEIAELLEAHSATLHEDVLEEETQLITAEDRVLLSSYQQSFDDEKIDNDLLVELVHRLYTSKDQGAILVFLPGYDDIITLQNSISEETKFDPSSYVLYVLHSSIQHSDQRRVFKVPPRGVRKIILSTNIAETSITINDVVFIVDGGKVKEKSFDALTSLTMLKSCWISKASALQRKGRAGRCQGGKCYHLFSRPRYIHLQDYQTPEILRVPLQELCLHTKLLAPNTDSIVSFLSKCPQAPPQLVISHAIQMLKRIDALDQNEDLTDLGQHLSDLPIEPRLGKMLLYSVVMKCLDPVLTIVCTLSFKDPFVLPSLPSQRRAVSAIRKKFAEDSFSDHLVLLRAFQAWQKAKVEGWGAAFCFKNFISSATMEMLVAMRNQVMGQLKALGFLRSRGPGDIRDLNTNSDNWALVKACLVAGTYPSIIQRRENLTLCTEKENNVRFHQSSVLQQSSCIANLKSMNQWRQYVKMLPSKWLLFEEMTRMQRASLTKCVSVVSAISVFLFAGPTRLAPDALKETVAPPKAENDDIDDEEEDSGDKSPCIHLDDWLTFQMESPQIALLAIQLRIKWHSLFLSHMRNPHQPWSQADETLLQVIIMLLSNAEKQMGMNNPVNVGQRPRAMGSPDEYFRQNPSSGLYQHSPHHQQFQHQHLPMHHQQYMRPTSANAAYSYQQRQHVPYDSPNPAASESKASGHGLNPTLQSNYNLASGKSPPVSLGEQKNVASENVDSYFFIMKCNSQRNLDISQTKSMWATTSVNEAKMNKAFTTGKKVFLIFSVQGSGHFQGFARMTSLISKDRCPEFNSPGLTGSFAIEWEKRANLPFQMTQQLVNPWNENRKVQVSRDGQEIEPKVGHALIKLWDRSSAQQGRQRSHSGSSKGQHRSHGRHHKGQQSSQRGKGGKDQHGVEK